MNCLTIIIIMILILLTNDLITTCIVLTLFHNPSNLVIDLQVPLFINQLIYISVLHLNHFLSLFYFLNILTSHQTSIQQCHKCNDSTVFLTCQCLLGNPDLPILAPVFPKWTHAYLILIKPFSIIPYDAHVVPPHDWWFISVVIVTLSVLNKVSTDGKEYDGNSINASKLLIMHVSSIIICCTSICQLQYRKEEYFTDESLIQLLRSSRNTVKFLDKFKFKCIFKNIGCNVEPVYSNFDEHI